MAEFLYLHGWLLVWTPGAQVAGIG
jgi:hypothetical protein